MRADFFSLSHSFDPDSGIVGLPRFGRENPLAPGGRLPGLSSKRSFLGQLGTRFDPEKQHFGLGDHVGVPISQLEAQFTSSLASAVTGLVGRARTLEGAAKVLVSGTSGGVFDRRMTRSSTTAVAAEAKESATVAAYAVDVSQLALAQQNVGSQLLSTLAPSDIAAGGHTVDVTVDGVTTAVNVTVNAGDTNLQALTAVRDAVNSAGAGVEATIVTTFDVSQLVLTAAQTGPAKGFTVVDQVGSVVADTGTGAPTRGAADALVTVNGVEYELDENRLSLDAPSSSGGERVTLFFQSVTEQTAQVDVRVSLNADAVVYATGRLLNAVNDLREYVADKPQILSRGLLARLNLAVEDLRGALTEIGVKVEDGGQMTLDAAALGLALADRPGEVQAAIGSIQGLAARERSVAETVLESSGVAFATKPGPLGAGYARTLEETVRLHNYLLGGLFVNLLA